MWTYISESELYHHGIMGMRWGKKNGPPYPLSPGAHSAAEKKANPSLGTDGNSGDTSKADKRDARAAAKSEKRAARVDEKEKKQKEKRRVDVDTGKIKDKYLTNAELKRRIERKSLEAELKKAREKEISDISEEDIKKGEALFKKAVIAYVGTVGASTLVGLYANRNKSAKEEPKIMRLEDTTSKFKIEDVSDKDLDKKIERMKKEATLNEIMQKIHSSSTSAAKNSPSKSSNTQSVQALSNAILSEIGKKVLVPAATGFTVYTLKRVVSKKTGDPKPNFMQEVFKTVNEKKK